MIKKTVIHLPQWKSLQSHFEVMSHGSMRQLFQSNSGRGVEFNIEAAGLYLDYSKNQVIAETIFLLVNLAEACQLKEKIDALFSGAHVNYSEKNASLHTALRSRESGVVLANDQNILFDIRTLLDRMRLFADRVRSNNLLGFTQKPIRHIVNIGVGGSHLGPMMTFHALKPFAHASLSFHFISNQDEIDCQEILEKIDPEKTLFIITSKSFTTKETMDNAKRVKEWLAANSGNHPAIQNQFVAVTQEVDTARAFGIPEENIFPMWSWIGGRYSIWSAVGLSLMIAIGFNRFEEFLAGADAMDQHFKKTDLHTNMPVILALLSIWYINFFNAQTQAIIPYTRRLLYLPEYLMQLYMESLGKSVRTDGSPVNYSTGAIVWGGIGTDSQHSFHQLFLQGTPLVPIDFILPLKDQNGSRVQLSMIANCLAQSETLLLGYDKKQIIQDLKNAGMCQSDINAVSPHKAIHGNNPSNIILFESLAPYQLGALLALHEHKVYTQSVIWDINAFDQWGVERGKKCANEILTSLHQNEMLASADSSTRALLSKILKIHTEKKERISS